VARIPYVDEAEASPEVAEALREVRRHHGTVSAVQSVLAHSPAALRAYERCALALRTVKGVEARARELVILRSAHILGNAYAWRRHLGSGREAGLTAEEIAALRESSASTTLADRDRILLRLVDEHLYLRQARADTIADVRAEYGDAQLVEILFVLGWYQLAATIMVPLDLAADDSNGGGA